MGKEKNNKWLILVLGLIILGLVCYIACSKILTSKKENTCTNENEPVKSNIFKDIVGSYSYKDNNSNITLVINSDGTASYNKDVTNASGGKATGKYSLTDNKIYIHNELCKPEYFENSDEKCGYGNCSPIVEFDYTNDNGTIKVYDTNPRHELTK